MTRCILKFYIQWVSLLFLISGCSTVYQTNEPKIIILKTPHIKYADQGYLRTNADEAQMQLFIAGVAVNTIEVDWCVCVDEGCMRKSSFNEDFLSEHYPSRLMLDVMLGKPIFEGKNRENTEDGFIQKIIEPNQYNIKYRVTKNSIFFKDRTNSIIIKIKDIN